jgi:hypothetical protein
MLHPNDNNSAGVFTVYIGKNYPHKWSTRQTKHPLPAPATFTREGNHKGDPEIHSCVYTRGQYPVSVLRGFAGLQATRWHPTCTRSAAPMTLTAIRPVSPC